MTRLLAIFLSLAASAVQAEAPRVAVDIAPVHSLVARVMQGVGEPDLILPANASPHAYSMRASEAAALEDADIVIWIGPGLTPWLERPIATLAADATKLSLLSSEGTIFYPYRDAGSDNHDNDEGHGHDKTDPHAWLDPENGIRWLDVIAEALAAKDLANAETYRANARAGAGEIRALQDRLAADLSDPSGVRYAVYHDAYQYFERRFGLEPVFAIASTHAVAPGPARIARLRDMARASGLSCVFAEPQQNTRLVATVVEGLDVRILKIDPLGAEIAHGPQLYMDILRAMADAVRSCA